MSNPWTKLVQEKFRLGRLSQPNFSLGQAMKSAKQVYKKGVSATSTLTRSLNPRKRKGGRSKKQRRSRGRH